MRQGITTALDLVAFAVAVYGGFQYDPTLGWFTLALVVGYVSWKLA